MPSSDFEPSRFGQRASGMAIPISELLEAKTFACQFKINRFSGPVRLRPDAKAFADVTLARDGVVTIPLGSADQGATISLELLGIRLRGYITPGALELYLRQPTFFEGYLWTRQLSAMQWTWGNEGTVSIRPLLDERLHPAKELVSVKHPCVDMTMDPRAPQGEEVLPTLNSKKPIAQGEWVGHDRVPLSTAPGQKPVAFLNTAPRSPEDAPDRVSILESGGAFRRIAYRLESSIVVGWVPTSALRVNVDSEDGPDAIELAWSGELAQPERPYKENDPTRLPPANAEFSRDSVVCAWNAPLAVEFGTAMLTVGTVASAIPLVPLDTRDGWREVLLAHPALKLATSARLWVPEDHVYPCIIRQ